MDIIQQRFLGKISPEKQGWHIIGVVGSRNSPIKEIMTAINNYENKSIDIANSTEKDVIARLRKLYGQENKGFGGVILFIDEMGKFLESAVRDKSDLHIFQEIAEEANNSSNGKLILVGALHQSFAEYANKLSKDIRDEWSKIQGRFKDMIINTSSEEQLDLISKAIETNLNTPHQKNMLRY